MYSVNNKWGFAILPENSIPDLSEKDLQLLMKPKFELLFY